MFLQASFVALETWKCLAHVRLVLSRSTCNVDILHFLMSHAATLVDVRLTLHTHVPVRTVREKAAVENVRVRKTRYEGACTYPATPVVFPRLTQMVLEKSDPGFLERVRCPLAHTIVFVAPMNDYGVLFRRARFPRLYELTLHLFACEATFPSDAPIHKTLRHVRVGLPPNYSLKKHTFVKELARHCPNALAVSARDGSWPLPH